MKGELLITEDLLDEIRNTLGSVFIYLDASDVAESARRMRPGKVNSSLTLEVQGTLEQVEDLVSKHVLRERDERRQRRAHHEQTYTEAGSELEYPDEYDDDVLVMCEPGTHQIDEDGYCEVCGYDEDQIEGEQGGGQAVDTAPDSD